MLRRKILLLSIFLVSLLAISAVSAAENATENIVSVNNDEDVISVENNQDALNSEESNVLMADESNESHVLQSDIGNTVEVLSASSTSKVSTDEVLGATNPESSAAEPVLKAKKTKIVKMNVKYKWATKKIGKFKIKARLWKVVFANGYTNYLDIILYKNGKQLSCNSYTSKYLYKVNGKWKWWGKWRHGGVNHIYHRYINYHPIKTIKVKFRY